MDIVPTLLATTYTKQDFQRRLTLLRGYLETIHFTKKKIEIREYLKDQGASDADTKALESWKITPTGKFTRTGMYDNLKELRETVATLPTVILFLPIVPTPEISETLGLWVRTHVSKEAMVEFRMEPEAVGGVKVSWNGKLADYSLSHEFGSIGQEIRNTINEFSIKQVRKQL